MTTEPGSDGIGIADAPGVPVTMASLGAQLRTLRKTRDLTLEQLAARSGVSAGLLSQMERGQGNPSFNTLVQVAHALSVPVASLFRPESTGSPVVRRADRRRIDIHAGGDADPAGEPTITELLTPSLAGALEVLLIEVPPGYSTRATPFTHEGEEFGLILQGRHEVHLGDATYTLDAGDSITYSSRIPHWYRNPGDEPVRSIWVITPPTF
jgi:transcriptional regulator with XRE-family HTH domain